MFDCILVANRGEIACRVIQTAQAMGVRCVAVYSDADREAKHVKMADVAKPIGGLVPSESYLCGDRIIEAALETKAEAIHPGYGFLSENPDFVDNVHASGLIFIGPSVDAIHAMGRKDAAKALMAEAGVPVVPGYHGSDHDPDVLMSEAAKIGFPILIKAVAGGGGRGMRQVNAANEFHAALTSAQNEALAAFGHEAVLIEKLIEKPRHIEFQVFGDREKVLHLFERDCSLQRRHQKVIEETPAPGMTEDVRDAMGSAAVRAAQAIGYEGAGTVEFIVDGSNGLHPDKFWFMEMNTRLQVEHPVTEAITGIDLVEWQLRVAAGDTLPFLQDDLKINGHAMEARLYAEDTAKGFLPTTGLLKHVNFPGDVRADSGVVTGDYISPWYDPMIAKIITHGTTRDRARERLAQALKNTEVCGTVTNLSFLGALVDQPDFVRGDVDTGLIQRSFDDLTLCHEPSNRDTAWAAIIAAGLEHPHGNAGFALWHNLRHSIDLKWGDQRKTVELEVHNADFINAFVNDETIEARNCGDGWRLDGHATPTATVLDGEIFVASKYGLVFEIMDPLAIVLADIDVNNIVTAPMPGLIKAVFVQEGDHVSVGDRLTVLEAMKMEHTLFAARDGTVETVAVTVGEQVVAGTALIALEQEPVQQ
ncbi:MAG: acetyl/propionyl/methylcrotonyl-CoA carboxylase subunit alpha [Aestuariivita sp.]|nr:acetyl/propionyl/methylcrotonyl-CoA carboxylase subunit alpha [Aestuariivita sp.]